MEKPSAREEKDPELERKISREITEVITTAELAGTGANAFVFKVTGGPVTGRLIEDLKRINPDVRPPTDLAMKTLKVYQPGAAQRELKVHRRAWEALWLKDDDPDTAKIPEVYFIYTAHFSEAERLLMAEQGFQIGESAEVVLMDYVPGRDLRRIMATEVMNRSAGATTEQIRRTTDPDSDYSYQFLSKRGWRIHPTVAQKIEKAIERLHQFKIRHRDLHEGNIMIIGDPTSESCQVYIIDFGSAEIGSESALSEKGVDDLAVARRIRLTYQASQEGELTEAETDYRADLERYQNRFFNHQRYLTFRELFLADQEKALNYLKTWDAKSIALVLMGALKEKLINSEEALKLVEEVKNQASLPSERRQLNWLSRYIFEQTVL